MRLLKSFVLHQSVIKTKHLRSLVRGIVRNFEWLEILGFTLQFHHIIANWLSFPVLYWNHTNSRNFSKWLLLVSFYFFPCSKEQYDTLYLIETVQDFLIKLDIKPLMHLLKISIFSLNNVILRLTKIMNRADKNWAHF